jgi:hypothetical protein
MLLTYTMQAVLESLGISQTPPEKIAQVLAEEGLTIEELKVLFDSKLHEHADQGYLSDAKSSPAQNLRNATEWDDSLVEQINPRRRFYPGQTYTPEDLSPHSTTDQGKRRQINKKKTCPLGGKKGPKIDFANVALLSRFALHSGATLWGRGLD